MFWTFIIPTNVTFDNRSQYAYSQNANFHINFAIFIQTLIGIYMFIRGISLDFYISFIRLQLKVFLPKHFGHFLWFWVPDSV